MNPKGVMTMKKFFLALAGGFVLAATVSFVFVSPVAALGNLVAANAVIGVGVWRIVK